MTQPGRVQSIERSIDIIMALADGPRTLTEVARATGLSKPTAFRLLATLSYRSMVMRVDDGNEYTLGPGLLHLVKGVLAGVGAFMGVAKKPLVELWRETEETVCIHVRLGLERVCVEELPGLSPVRYVAEVGASVPLPIGAASRVLLAFANSTSRARTLAALCEADAGLDLQALKRELDNVRDQGWAESSGERIAGAAAISVPIHGPDGLLASLSVLGPADRLSDERRQELLPLVRTAAERVERLLAAAIGMKRR
jgi:IclR family KDG regulon transcriptional repressor